jgi:hypothetical protein
MRPPFQAFPIWKYSCALRRTIFLNYWILTLPHSLLDLIMENVSGLRLSYHSDKGTVLRQFSTVYFQLHISFTFCKVVGSGNECMDIYWAKSSETVCLTLIIRATIKNDYVVLTYRVVCDFYGGKEGGFSSWGGRSRILHLTANELEIERYNGQAPSPHWVGEAQ